MKPAYFGFTCIIAVYLLVLSCVSGPASISEEELYSLGKAYYDLGKYTEAEIWFQKASKYSKTKNASMYYLGRIAFQQQKYTKAASIFEILLNKDKDNVILLKAAAFSNLKALNFEKAELYYRRVIELVPESKESKYGYALVLYGIQKYSESYQLLKEMKADDGNDKDALLLLARTEKMLAYPEAIDHYSQWLKKNDDPQILKEYAEVAEQLALYSRAIEALKKIKQTNREELAGLQKGEVDFRIGRLIIFADPLDNQGFKHIESALSAGYQNKEQFDVLLADTRLTETQKRTLQTLFYDNKDHEKKY
ncbi:tetratricopeptide repeat protein [Gracilinema caldarium]|uniref:Tetratricopeptide TPR_2 repeat-containing protein n=1 Tax=Gracilinema caldarium (strain ATCC 51460 / DSM 7334 / H1) TaxID=744872 RepID=F8EXQ7_GRAC1|nr:tetratricopeptide repeat protein [Gracilinema caldarium]AEJ19638.1 Tetratricopeptide TPR_2 repeat-containing protein [Gracilinema caldarium DSM 7334]